MSFKEVLERISQDIHKELPDNSEITQIEFEGPEVAVYSKNPRVLVNDETIVKELAKLNRADLREFKKRYSLAIEKSISCNRVGMTVIGLDVPHVHVHLIPLNSMNDIDFKHKVNLNETEFKAIANKISSLL